MKILFFAPLLSDYYKDIIKELESRGNTVKWYYDSLKLNSIQRIINKGFKGIYEKKFSKYIAKIIKENDDDFDVVTLIFGGNYFKNEHVSLLKNKYKKAKFVYFNWDSIANYKNILKYIDLFDYKYSFDNEDCKKYNFKFLPLFFIKEDRNLESKYDYCSVMTYHKNKSKDYNHVKSILDNNRKGFEYLFIGNFFTYILYKLFPNKSNRNISRSCFKHKKISKEMTYNHILDSKAVIDCPRSNQCGLTMRTFETLALGKKLITTNSNIKKYDFYNEDNIFVVDDNTKSIPDSFFDKPFVENERFSKEYNISSFVDVLFYQKDEFKYLLEEK